MKLLFDQNLS
jgi:predicted nuclease of predicted toxin-antitoxin system